MQQLLSDIKPGQMLSTLIYAVIGMVVFGVAFAWQPEHFLSFAALPLTL